MAAKIKRSKDPQKAAYDAGCKRILSEKIILAWIMKSSMKEYYNYNAAEIAEKYIEGQPQISEITVAPEENGTMINGTGSEDSSISEGKVTYDIRFNAIVPGTGEHIGLIINIEAQLKFYPGYPLTKRAFYYCGRLISSQYGREFTKSHYEKMKKVYSIWICMNPPKKRRNTITRYQINEENLVGNVHEKSKNYDLLSVIMICLGGPEDKNYSGVLELLDILFTDRYITSEKKKLLKEKFNIEMTEYLESEVSAMCNWSDGIEERGIEKGIKQGRREGRKEGKMEGKIEGRKEGRKETLVESLRNLTETLGLSLEAAMAALKIPESEWELFANLLQHPLK